MLEQEGFQGWLKKYWEKPFFDAEMHRYEILKKEPGERVNMTPVALLGVFAELFIGFCIYLFVEFFVT